jgi:hypothetical protein
MRQILKRPLLPLEKGIQKLVDHYTTEQVRPLRGEAQFTLSRKTA